MLTDDASALLSESLGSLELDERIVTHGEFARTLMVPNAAPPPKHLPWNPANDPAQAWLIKQLDDDRWERFYVCSSPQYAGKTQTVVMLPALRCAIGQSQPVGYALPTLADVDLAWTTKIRKAIENSGYGAFLPKKGPGSRGGRPVSIQFRDPVSLEEKGELVFMAGGAYGSTVKTVAIDEIDQFRKADKTPMWTEIEDCFARANRFGKRARRIGTGTVEVDEGSIILTLVAEGTDTRMHARCPHCKAHARISWDQVKYDKTDDDAIMETAAIYCRSCAAKWSESDRVDALHNALFVHRGQRVADGIVIGPAPRTTFLGFLWNSLECVRAHVGQIARDFEKAKAKAEDGDAQVRKWYRYSLCEYPPKDANEKRASLDQAAVTNAKSADHRRGKLPEWVKWLFMPVDTQLRRHYWAVLGFDETRCCWIDWGQDAICGDMEQPLQEQRHAGYDRLEKMAESGLMKPDGTALPFARCGIDCGFRPEEIRPWIAQNRPRWIALKGAGEELQDRMAKGNPGKREDFEEGWYELRDQPDQPDGRQLFAPADDLRDRLAEWLASGRMILPADADKSLVDSLSGMKRGVAPKRWVAKSARHDYLDLGVYGLAMWRREMRSSGDTGGTLPILNDPSFARMLL